MSEITLDEYELYNIEKYHSIAEGIKLVKPDLLKDPIIATACVQMESAEMLLKNKLAGMVEDDNG